MSNKKINAYSNLLFALCVKTENSDLFRTVKKIRNEFTGVLTGKAINRGRSLLHPEATGFGTVYFTKEMLKTKNGSFSWKTFFVSSFVIVPR